MLKGENKGGVVLMVKGELEGRDGLNRFKLAGEDGEGKGRDSGVNWRLGLIDTIS